MSQSNSSGDPATPVASWGRGNRLAVPSSYCCLGPISAASASTAFQSVVPSFCSPSKGLAFLYPVECSLASASLREAPSLEGGSVHTCLSNWFGLDAPVVATPASRIPTVAGILLAALGPASAGLWGFGGPSTPFSTFCGTGDASKTVSPPWLGVRARRILRIADQL